MTKHLNEYEPVTGTSIDSRLSPRGLSWPLALQLLFPRTIGASLRAYDMKRAWQSQKVNSSRILYLV